MILEIVIALLREISRLFQQLGFFTKQLGLLFTKAVERVFQLREVHLLASDLPAISRRQIDGDNFIHFCVPLLFVVILPELAGSRFQLERDYYQAATRILERLGYGVESGLTF